MIEITGLLTCTADIAPASTDGTTRLNPIARQMLYDAVERIEALESMIEYLQDGGTDLETFKKHLNL